MAEIRAGVRPTECIKGHIFDEANTYWNGGARYCRKCRNERVRLKRQANPEKERERNRRRRAMAVLLQRAG
jgi:hypothetical protein